MDIERLIVRFTADAGDYLRTLDSVINMAARTASTLKQTLSGVTDGIKDMAKGITDNIRGVVTGSFNSLVNMVGGVASGAFSALTSAAGGAASILTGVLAAGVGVATATLAALLDVTVKVGSEAISLGAAYEKAAISFEVMTGSAATGKQMLEDLIQLAIRTPFQSPEVIAGAKQLMAFGAAPAEVLPTLEALGNVSSGTERDLNRLVHAFGQVREQGKLMGMQMREFVSAGVPLSQNLAAVMGVNETAIRKMMHDGQISYNAVVDAFNRMTQAGGRFAGLNDRLQETVIGRWNALKETIENALRALGVAFFKGFGLAGLLEQWQNQIGDLRGSMSQLEGVFANVRKAFDVIIEAARATVTELGKMIGGGDWSWDKLEGIAIRTLKGIIDFIGLLLDAIKNVGVFIMQWMIRPLIQVAEVVGLLEGRNAQGQATTYYQMARDEGSSRIVSGMASLGFNVIDEVASALGGPGDVVALGLEKQGRLGRGGSSNVSNIDAAINAMKGLDPQAVTDRVNRAFEKRLLEMQQRQDEMMIGGKYNPGHQERMRQAHMGTMMLEEMRYLQSDEGIRKVQQLMAPGTVDAGRANEMVRQRMSEIKGTDEWFDEQWKAVREGRRANPPKESDRMPFEDQHRMREVRRAAITEGMGRPGMSHAEAAQRVLTDTFGNLNDRLKAWAQATVGMDENTGEVRRQMARIPKSLQVSADAVGAANKVVSEFTKGGTPFEKFSETFKHLQEAAAGPDMTGVMGAFGAPAGATGFGKLLTPEQFKFGVFKSFEDLQKAVQETQKNAEKLPTAAQQGTAEAMSAVNQAKQQTDSFEENMLNVLTAAKVAAERTKDYQKRAVELLQKIAKEGFFDEEEIE